MKYRRTGKDRKQEEKNSKVSENNCTMKEKKRKEWENRGTYFALKKKKKKGMLCIYLLNFDEFTTWHGVFLATFHQRIHILNNDKGSLLQGDNTQMIIIRVTVCKRAVPRPDRVLQAQWVVLPFPHLKCQETHAADICLLVSDKWHLILNVLGYRYRKLITLQRQLSWAFVIKVTLELFSNCMKWENAMW